MFKKEDEEKKTPEPQAEVPAAEPEKQAAPAGPDAEQTASTAAAPAEKPAAETEKQPESKPEQAAPCEPNTAEGAETDSAPAEETAEAPENKPADEPEKPPAPQPEQQAKQKNRARLPLPLRILLGVFCLVLVVLGLAIAYVNGKLDLIHYSDGTIDGIGTIGAGEDQDLDSTGLAHSDGEMLMPEGSPFADDSVLNVLLISTDERTEAVNDADAFTNLGQLDGSRSSTEFSSDARADSLILASLNIDEDTIKLVSIERATGVPILLDEYEDEYDWITHTFRYGGARLTMDTVETCFGVQVDHYVRFNFNSFVQIVDAVGGIDIELTEQEAAALNWEVPSNSMLIVNRVHAGLNHLDGYTALQYARLRSIDNDWQRIVRQRTVIQAVLNQVQNASVTELDNLLNTVLPLVQTNFTKAEIAALLVQLPGFLGVQAEQMSMPVEGTYGARIGMDDRTMYDPDWRVNSRILRDFLYDGMTAEEAIAAHVDGAETPETAAEETGAGGYLGAYAQELGAEQPLDTEKFGASAYRVFLAGGQTGEAETWTAAQALLRSLHERQGVNALLYDCGPAAALALNDQMARWLDPLADAAQTQEEAEFWSWLSFYNGLQSSSTTLEIVGIGEEDDPLLAMQGLRTLYAATLPAIDPDTLTCEPARAAWRHMQEEATYTDPARAEQTLRTLRALAGQESAESDLYQFFSGNVNWARQLLAAMSVQGSDAAACAERLEAMWPHYSNENFFALCSQADIAAGSDTLAAAMNAADSPVADRVCTVLLYSLEAGPGDGGTELPDAEALYADAQDAIAAAAKAAEEAAAAAEQAEREAQDQALAAVERAEALEDGAAPQPTPEPTPDPTPEPTPEPTATPLPEETQDPVLFIALDGEDSPYAGLGADKLVLIPTSTAATPLPTPEPEAAEG